MTRPAVVIAGAGIIGCLIARELAALDPEISVTVLDRDAVGAGASRRSAGLHLPRGASPRTRRMSAFSHAYYAELRSRHPALPIYPVGATVIGPDGGSDHGPDGGPGPDYLSEAAPVRAAGSGHPAVGVPDGCLAWRLSGCHHADVGQLARRLAAGLRPRVRFAEGVAVTRLTAGPGAVTVTTGTGERLVAGHVVLAPGPWLTAPAWRDLVAPLGLRVKKVIALHIGQRPEPEEPAVLFDDDDAFLLPVGHQGHWLFSYASPRWDVDPDAPARGLSLAEVSAGRDLLRRYSPSLAAACDSGRVFCDAYSPDREPLVRPLDDAGRIIFAGAASGSGYRLAPAIAAEVASMVQPRLGDTATEGVPGDHQYV
jgi:glycine/D-amino acid oxidase-like deaminating enzyme